MAIKDLTPDERDLLHRCLQAMAEDREIIPDWEFPIIFGFRREMVINTINRWPDLDERDPEVIDVFRACLNNLTGYPHREWHRLSFTEEEAQAIWAKWDADLPPEYPLPAEFITYDPPPNPRRVDGPLLLAPAALNLAGFTLAQAVSSLSHLPPQEEAPCFAFRQKDGRRELIPCQSRDGAYKNFSGCGGRSWREIDAWSLIEEINLRRDGWDLAFSIAIDAPRMTENVRLIQRIIRPSGGGICLLESIGFVFSYRFYPLAPFDPITLEIRRGFADHPQGGALWPPDR